MNEPVEESGVGGRPRPDDERDPGGEAPRRVRVVLVTAPNEETGEFLAKEMVEERLAACGNVIPGLVSVYWWEDEVQRDDEVLVLLKTTDEHTDRLVERVRALHPYDVPEILAVPVSGGLQEYARWVLRECEPGNEE